MQKILNILFIVIAVLTLVEYWFILGMFTGIIMLIAVLVIGIVNVIYSALHKRFYEAILYALCTLALCSGYLKLMI